MAISTFHPRFGIVTAIVQFIRESNTLAGNNVFPDRLELYDLKNVNTPIISVFIDEEQHIERTMPPDYRRHLLLSVDCWQPVGRDVDYVANLSRLSAEIESVMHTGRNNVRELTPDTAWWRAPIYEKYEKSLISDEATIRYTAQTYTYSCEYEWVPGLTVDGLNSFQKLYNSWLLPVAVHPEILTRTTLQGG